MPKTKLKFSLPWKHLPGRVLSMELADHAIRAVVLEKTGSRVSVVHAAAKERTGAGIAGDIEALTGALGGYKGNAVVVSDRVRFLAGELAFKDADKLSQEKIDEAAKWEIEPFLDFPSQHSLFSCRLQTGLKRKDAVPALIFAMHREEYTSISDHFKKSGMQLHCAYAPEAALACAAPVPKKAENTIVLDHGAAGLKGVVLTPDGPAVFQDQPMTAQESGRDELLRNMIYDLEALAGGSGEIILTGESASMGFTGPLGTESEPVSIWDHTVYDALEKGPLAGGFGPEYAMATGAGLQYLGCCGQDIPGVTDRVALTRTLQELFRKNKRLAPGLAAGVLIAIMAVHFTFTKVAISGYSSRINGLKAQQAKLLKPVKEKEKLARDLAGIKEKQSYLETVLNGSNGNLINLLGAVSGQIPKDVVLSRIYYKTATMYCIEGNALFGQSISAFENILSDVCGCRSTVLETLHRMEDGPGTRERLLPYKFVLNIEF